MKKLPRRTFVGTGLLGGIAAALSGDVLGAGATTLRPTPRETEGPFYPVNAQKDKDFDLTIIEGHEQRAKGDVIVIQGRVIDTHGEPIEDATVELWQANAAGRYRHPHDRSRRPLDPNFQGWAVVPSGKEGGFRFKTIFPGTYPAGRNWSRPPHIHFKVTRPGYFTLTTQMYFPGHKLNKKDFLLNRKSAKEQALMIARASESEKHLYQYDIILQEAG